MVKRKDLKKQIFLAITALSIGIFLTALSLLFHDSGRQAICVPKNPGPLDELGARMRYERGLPWRYYRDPVPKDCSSLSLVIAAKQEGQVVDIPNLVADITTWTIIGAIIVVVSPRKARSTVR